MDVSRELSKTAPPEESPAPANVPEIVRIGSIPTNMTMDVDSDILEPVVKSQSFIRYVLDNKGLLHSNSKLIFSMTQSGHGQRFFPLGIGAMSLIERATLKVGTKEINSIQDWNHYQGYRSTFVSPENMKEREMFTTGRCLGYDFEYKNNASLESNTEADKYQIDCGRQAKVTYATVGTDTSETPLPSLLRLDKEAEFQINLSDLFPFLKMNQLPLYMIKEQISIELRLSPKDLYQRMSRATGAAANREIDINLDKCKMIADYIFYPTEVMEAYSRQNQNMTFTYMDYFLSKQGFSATTGTNVEQIRNIGGAGKIVTKTFVALSRDNEDEDFLLNNFSSVSCSQATTFSGSLVANLKYNGHFLYPIDRENNALHYHDVAQAEGSLPFVTRAEYSDENASDITGSKFETRIQTDSLTGKFFRQAYRLNRSERVNSRGIELFHTYKTLITGGYTQRCWVESVKMANLSNGMMTIVDA